MVLKHGWKKRSLYGNQMLKKIKKLSKQFDTELSEDKPDITKLSQYTKMYGYLVQVQLSNINKIEEFEMLQKMEGVESDHKYQESIPQVVTETSQVKF